ncbi:MAG: hypothetical protein O2973_06795 [Gemmatimonadetes bacterium]|nr:hypothetical protein [Gemmatimonadota bacterium]
MNAPTPNQFRRLAVAVSVWSVWSVCSVATFAVPTPAQAQQAEKLGTISFPNSGNAAAQSGFINGMLLYYSFEYDRAGASFRDAQKADPSFALAYWGEALAQTHQVWNQQDLAGARAILARLAPTPAARRAKAGTEREKMYMDAVEILYGDGPKARRDTLFTAAIERIERAHPSDDEAKVLHAVGLLGLNQGVRDFTTYMQAGALAEGVLRHNPDHPAAAHFIIHAFDDPTHAPLGLWAARLYSKIAPGAPHAQHMTSHIYVAMGLWDDVVSQNVIASGPNKDAYRAGHYTWWLGYAYGQQGRYAEAKSHLVTMHRNAKSPVAPGEANGLVNVRAHYVIDGEHWTDDVLSWKLASVGPGAAVDSFVVGLAAVNRQERPTAARASAYLSAGAKSAPAAQRAALNVLSKELAAAISSSSGKHAEATTLARDAAAAEEAMPFEFGPPKFPKPTYELLGEVLLAAGNAGEAQIAFQKSLARTPGRSRSLVGLARAASAAGDKATAESAVAHLKSNWHGADKNLPELAELTRLVAAGTK